MIMVSILFKFLAMATYFPNVPKLELFPSSVQHCNDRAKGMMCYDLIITSFTLSSLCSWCWHSGD